MSRCTAILFIVAASAVHRAIGDDRPLPRRCLDPNQEWNECGGPCEARCDEPREPGTTCATICIPRCTCKPGYVIGPHEKCIPKNECPNNKTCSDPNQVWSDCGTICEPKCHEPTGIIATCAPICIPKCICKPEHVIGPDGKCIPRNDCPIIRTCPDPNQVWKNCSSVCQPRCEQPGAPIKPCVEPSICIPKCECKPGYVIGHHEKCIPRDECPNNKTCLDPNQVWSDCGRACEPKCHEPTGPIATCAPICIPKCICKPEHVIGPDGKCIPKNDCPINRTCPDPNQVWKNCSSVCEPRCEPQPGGPIKPCVEPSICTPKCECKPGYVIGFGGRCIPRDQCPINKRCLGEHQVWNSCGSHCEPTCVKPKEPMSCAAVCVPKCTCKPGFILDPHGNCISKEECSRRDKCVGPKYAWNDCGSGCEPRCIPPKVPTMCPAVCISKCSCAPGYIIGPDEDCITIQDCENLKKCQPNEIWTPCGHDCEPRCIEPNPRPPCPPVCVAKCSCKPGLVRDPNNKCVPKSGCPTDKTCTNPNQVWNDCGSLCEPQCIKPVVPKKCPALCVPKCVCKPGYTLGPDGRCISNDECLKRRTCVGPSHVWNNCGSGCEPRCIPPKEPQGCAAVCVSKCSCAPGYIIGPNGDCITIKDCENLKKCHPNEIWTPCGSYCESRCIEPIHRPTCPPVCVAKCSCKPGSVRDPNNKCVPRSDCQRNKTCTDVNSVWKDCGSLCEPECIKPKEPKPCPALCVPKCVCKPGYILGPNGRCISSDECSRRNKCVGPSHVWNNCGSGCEPRCIPLKEPRVCAAVCTPKCSCARGYIIGPVNQTCITTKDCENLKKCGQNEIWTDCGSRCEPRCVTIPTHQPTCPPECIPKCSCKPGFWRTHDGKCVRANECTAPP